MRVGRVVIGMLLAAAVWLLLAPFSPAEGEAGCRGPIFGPGGERSACGHGADVRSGQAFAAVAIAGGVAAGGVLADAWARQEGGTGGNRSYGTGPSSRSHYD